MHAHVCLWASQQASSHTQPPFWAPKKQKHRVVASFINEVLARAPPPLPHLLCFKYPEHRFPWRLQVWGGRWTSCRYSSAVYSLADTHKLVPLWSSRLMKSQCGHVRSGQLLRPCLYLLHTCSFSSCLLAPMPVWVHKQCPALCEATMPVRWVLTLTLEDEKEKARQSFSLLHEGELIYFRRTSWKFSISVLWLSHPVAVSAFLLLLLLLFTPLPSCP